MSFEEAEILARRMGMAGVVETSAKEGNETLDDAFYIAIANALDLMEGQREVSIINQPSNSQLDKIT